jgi:hypothetical protein
MKKHFLLCFALACSGLAQPAEKPKKEAEIPQFVEHNGRTYETAQFSDLQKFAYSRILREQDSEQKTERLNLFFEPFEDDNFEQPLMQEPVGAQQPDVSPAARQTAKEIAFDEIFAAKIAAGIDDERALRETKEEMERDAQEAAIADVQEPSALSSCGCTGACGCADNSADFDRKKVTIIDGAEEARAIPSSRYLQSDSDFDREVEQRLEQEKDKCALCLEDDFNCTIECCKQFFHETCFDRWDKDSCPACRTVSDFDITFFDEFMRENREKEKKARIQKELKDKKEKERLEQLALAAYKPSLDCFTPKHADSDTCFVCKALLDASSTKVVRNSKGLLSHISCKPAELPTYSGYGLLDDPKTKDKK